MKFIDQCSVDTMSGFVPTGNRSGNRSWHPSGRDAAPPNGLPFVSQPATGHHLGLWSLPWAQGALDNRRHTQRWAQAAWAPCPHPQPPRAWSLAQSPGDQFCCPMHKQNKKPRSLFLKQWHQTRASSYGNKPPPGFGEGALVHLLLLE